VQASIGVGFNGIQATHVYSVAITGPPVYITPSSLPNGTLGTTYSQVLTAFGGYGTGTYTFSMDPTSAGSLPPGLTITTAGTISGTPAQIGIFIFSVRLTSQTVNGASVSTSQAYSITIAGPPLTITTTSLPGGTVGALYSQALSATGGTPLYTWQVTGGSLPGGLSLNSAAGNIYGTPTAAGSFTFQVKVTDSQQASATGSFTMRITAAALTITTASLPNGTVGTVYTATGLAATGGTSPYTWSVASGALPGGLSISSAGVVSGTPTVSGSFSVTLQVTDSAQATATRSYSVTVAAAAVPLSITTPSPLPNGVVGAAYTLTFAGTGGAPPYNWELSAGALPPGLAVNGLTGGLTGTPTAAGTYNFTLQVVDSTERTAPKAFTITVIAAVKISTAPALPDGTAGVLYTVQFLASGGVTPYTWSVASGSIPSGLSLNTATGLLSGTPDSSLTYTFTIAVTDQNGQKDSAAYTIKIVAPLNFTTQTPLPGGVVGVSYAQTFAATGGTPPYQWSVSTGALPTGLTLNAAGSLTGTPTAAGTFNFTVQVVDAAGRSATASFTITVTAALTITTATLPNGTVGSAYSQTLVLAGGSGTFTWSVSTGTLPGGITLNPATGLLSGTPSAPGTFTFTVSATGGGQSAKQSLTITVGVPQAPPVTITGLPATATPATQPVLGIAIPNAYPLDVTGQVTLTFTPDPPSPDGQEVVFTTGGRTVNFTVPANTTQAVFSGATPGVQTGTVSGTITLTLKLTAAGIDVTPSPAPTTTLVIPKSAPVIRTATVSGVTSSGFNLVVVGYATSREMVSATVTFTAASGVSLASSSAPVSLTSVFTTWYQSSASAPYGSQFSLTMPFTIANGTSTNPLASVSVQLTNSQGSSTTVSAPY
jgi:hypothetical protein